MAAGRRELDGWMETPDGALALMILLDQYPRNSFRGTHRDIIIRFGRFPHRNAALGRVTTAEEQAFLDGGGFGG
jgi:uncharacterized protein (DUF924 family)